MKNIAPRRSALYMPASNQRALEKARSLVVDGIIIDLEDAVAPEAKTEARNHAVSALKEGGFDGKYVTVRINGQDTPWGEEDLQAICQAAPDAILIPKVSSPVQVSEMIAKFEQFQAPEHCRLEVMIETPLGVLNVAAISAAHARLSVLVAGTNDLSKELDTIYQSDRAPLVTSLQMIVLAAKANGKIALDGVFNDLNDTETFTQECKQGLIFGFDGKTLIHPKQIDPCHAVFSPSREEIALAEKQIAVFEAALSEGKGIAVLDGKILENLHIARAKKILAIAASVNQEKLPL